MTKVGYGSNLPYRKGVGILLFNAEGWVFVAQRIDQTAEAWQLPQGGIDEGEDPFEAAMRELAEETSVTSVEPLAETKEWLRYDLPSDLVPHLWGGRFRGQEQKWYALRFTGEESEINLATPHPEFHAWKWTSLESIPSLIVPFKRALYERLVQEFSTYR